MFEHFHQAIVDRIEALSKKTNASAKSHKDAQRHDDDDPPQGAGQSKAQQQRAEDSVSEDESGTAPKNHRGKLIVDATVA